MDGEHLRDLGGRLVRPDGLHSDLGLQAGRVILSGSERCLCAIFNAAHHLMKSRFHVPERGSTTLDYDHPLTVRGRFAVINKGVCTAPQ